MSKESDILYKDKKLLKRRLSIEIIEIVQSSNNPKSAQGNHPGKEASLESMFEKNETTSIQNKVGDIENDFDCKKCGEGFRDILGVMEHDCPKKETQPESPLKMMGIFDLLREKKMSKVEGEKSSSVNALVSLTSIESTQTRKISKNDSPGSSKQELEVSISSQNLNLHAGTCNVPTEPEIVDIIPVSHSTPKKSSPSTKDFSNISSKSSTEYFSNVFNNPEMRAAPLLPQSHNIDFSTSPRVVKSLHAPGGSYLAHKNSNYGYIETPFKWPTFATPPRSSPSSNIHRYYRSRSMSPTALNLSQPPPSYNASKKWSSTSKLTKDVYTKSPKYSTPKCPSQSFQTCIDNTSKGLMNLGSVNLFQSPRRYNTGRTKQSPQTESMSPSLTSPQHQSHVLEHFTKDPSRSFSPSELGYSLQSPRKSSSSVETISPSRMEIDRYSTFVTPEKTYKSPNTSADNSWSRFRSPAALHSSISSQSSDSSGEKISPHTKWKKQWEERYRSSAEYKLASPSDKVLTNDSSVGFDNLGVLNLSQSSQGSRDLTDNLIEEPELERSNFNFVTPKRLSPPSKASTSDSSGSFVSPEAMQVSPLPRQVSPLPQQDSSLPRLLNFSALRRSPRTKRVRETYDESLTFTKGKKSSNPPKR